MLRKGAARVNGHSVKKAHRLALGDLVELELPAVDVPHEEIAAIELPVLFEDDDLIVVNKPPGLPVHPASTCPYVNALARLQLRYTQDFPDPSAEPSVIHRLDRGTSGVIAFARRRGLVAYYAGQFERRTVGKRYIAIVEGQPPDQAVIDTPLLVVDGQRVTAHPDGKPSHTEYRVIARTPTLALVQIVLRTGRKHQIRAHFTSEGFPLLYDDLYRRRAPDEVWPPDARPMLHARQLQLTHRTDGPMVFDAPLPMDMATVWTTAGGTLDADMLG